MRGMKLAGLKIPQIKDNSLITFAPVSPGVYFIRKSVFLALCKVISLIILRTSERQVTLSYSVPAIQHQCTAGVQQIIT